MGKDYFISLGDLWENARAIRRGEHDIKLTDVLYDEEGNASTVEEFLNRRILMAINLSPSFNWSNPDKWDSWLEKDQIKNIKLAMQSEDFDWRNSETWGEYNLDVQAMLEAIDSFSRVMGEMGYNGHFVTIFQDHTNTLPMWNAGQELVNRGAAGFVRFVQQEEQRVGSRFFNHQEGAGTIRVNEDEQLFVRGASSTGARGKQDTLMEQAKVVTEEGLGDKVLREREQGLERIAAVPRSNPNVDQLRDAIVERQDGAMADTAANGQDWIRGGIQMSTSAFDGVLRIKRDGNGVPLPVNQQPLENINQNLPGLNYNILYIQPIAPAAVPMILGLKKDESEVEEGQLSRI
jgi:hypothetical protein